MKSFLLADKKVQFISVVAANKPSFSIGSIVSSRLLHVKKVILALVALLLCSVAIHAQQSTDTAYQKVLADRTAKIVNTLGIADAALYKKVQQQLTDQYIGLNAIQDKSKATVAAIKARSLSKGAIDTAVKQEEENKTAALKKLHNDFIASLKATLNEGQVEKIKDGMTYSILPVTWKAYLEMIPTLTQVQKDKMYGWLVEARELAMDEGSSDKKHAVFGKYKGRINNYLSAEGYDMKKEEADWAKRIQAAKETKQTN